jgi:hypothetical protein
MIVRASVHERTSLKKCPDSPQNQTARNPHGDKDRGKRSTSQLSRQKLSTDQRPHESPRHAHSTLNCKKFF